MPFYYRIRIEEVMSAVQTLEKASEQMTQVEAYIKEHGIDEVCLSFNQQQLDSVDIIRTLASQCAAILPYLIERKDQIQSVNFLRNQGSRRRK